MRDKRRGEREIKHRKGGINFFFVGFFVREWARMDTNFLNANDANYANYADENLISTSFKQQNNLSSATGYANAHNLITLFLSANGREWIRIFLNANCANYADENSVKLCETLCLCAE